MNPAHIFYARMENGLARQIVTIPIAQQYRAQDYLANDCGLGGEWEAVSETGYRLGAPNTTQLWRGRPAGFDCGCDDGRPFFIVA